MTTAWLGPAARRRLATSAVVAATLACGGTRPAAAPDEPRPIPSTVVPEGSDPLATPPPPLPHVPADARFMRHMIAHHAQALVMTGMVRDRSTRAEMALMAERIAISQGDETRLMEQWLRRRGEAVPAVPAAVTAGAHAHHGAAADSATHATMPGMLAPAELARLEQARGLAFDRLFLELMIRHHEGALVMVAELLRTPGAAQESEIYRFAADVDADQRAEIRRMRALLAALGT